MLTTNKFFCLSVTAIILYYFEITLGKPENNCFCTFNGQNCTGDINKDITFYYSAKFNCNGWQVCNQKPHFLTEGVVQCWDSQFAPDVIQIMKCNKGENISAVRDRVTFQAGDVFENNTEHNLNKDFLLTCIVDNETNTTDQLNTSLHSEFNQRSVLNEIVSNVVSLERTTLLIINNVNLNFDEKILLNFPTLNLLSLTSINITRIPTKISSKSLLNVDLSDNNIQYIPTEVFNSFAALPLRALNLSCNEIKCLGYCCSGVKMPNATIHWNSLLTLDLSHNEISMICFNFFEFARELTTIFLRNNEITSLDNVFLGDQNNIRRLNLTRNKLRLISDTDFAFLHSLLYLDLSSNEIIFIEKSAFKNLRQLNSISLDNNFLDFKGYSAPYLPGTLRYLSLNNNRFTSLPDFDWESLKIFRLRLMGNRISYVNPHDFSFLFTFEGSKRVYLQNNVIETFDLQELRTKMNNSDIFVNVKFYLDGNPLRCDCAVKRLREYVKDGFNLNSNFTIKFKAKNLYCHQPQSLQNVLFQNVESKLLRCLDNEHCPRVCKCSFLEFETVVNCEEGNLKHIPHNLSTNTTSLTLSFNPLMTLQTLQKLEKIEMLTIDHCPNLEFILKSENISFSSLRNLNHLSLQHSNLSDTSYTSLTNITNLISLKLSHNQFQTLPNTLLASLQNLKRVFLNNNIISSLPETAFETNFELEIIDLHCNNLPHITLNISHLSNLSSVDISKNSLRWILITWPENVKEILLSDNRLTSFNFANLPLNLHHLDLNNNHFETLDIDKLSHFTHNVILDFSNNKINNFSFAEKNLNQIKSQISTEVTIILNSNPISCDCKLKSFLSYLKLSQDTTIPMRYIFQIEELICDFPALVKGQRLIDLSQLPCIVVNNCPEKCHCFIIPVFDYHSMECLNFPQSLLANTTTALHIIHTNIRDFNRLVMPQWNSLREIVVKNLSTYSENLIPKLFSNMANLTSLTIQNCDNLRVSNSTFSGLSKLLRLDLSHDEIFELDETSFSGNIGLRNLNLSHNLLTSLPNNFFSELSQLTTLDLSNNKLMILDNQLFKNLENLENIFLQNNQLKSLANNIFSQCQILKKLDLSQNLLASNITQFLYIPPKVTYLNFSRNIINNITKSWSNLRDLQILDLSYNVIQTLSLSQLTSFPLTSSIHLHSNNISNIDNFERILPRNSENNFFELIDDGTITLTLKNNPFKCDCNLTYFIAVLKQDLNIPLRVSDSYALTCAQPINLRNACLENVSNKDLFCHLNTCPDGCDCKQQGLVGDVVVDCNINVSLDILKCPSRVDVLILRGNLSSTKFQNNCWKKVKKLHTSENFLIGDFAHNFLRRYYSLQELSIVSSGLQSIPLEIFHPIPYLEMVDFSNNQITTSVWDIPKSLQFLNLAHNKIQSFELSLIIDFKLRSLNLSYNMLHEPSSIFVFDFENLRILDLSHNNIAVNCNNDVIAFPQSLKTLNISHNQLNCTDFLDRSEEYAIRYFDLSSNPISTFEIKDFLFNNNSNVIVNLKNCTLVNYSLSAGDTTNKIWNNSVTIDVNNNLGIECFCYITQDDLIQEQNVNLTIIDNITCNVNNFDLNLDVTSSLGLFASTTVCSVFVDCPFHCTCLNSDNIVRVFCVNKGFNSLPSKSPLNSRYLNLDFNNITELVGLNQTHWKNLIEISVRYNKIATLLDENLSSLLSLNAVYLDGNKLSSPSGWLENLVQTNTLPFHLTLSGNPWLCNCKTKKFQNWILDFSKTQMILDNWNISCADGNLLINFEMCPTDIWEILLPILLIVIVLIIILMLTVFYYRQKTLILAWLYSKNLCGCCVQEDDVDVEKDYDAFLSYAEEDSEFVTRVLLPGLENNEPFYKICVHNRDWSAGQSIMEQIEMSIKNSRRVIFVVSQNFTRSMWANIEFKYANFQSVQDKMNRIIIITLEEDFGINELDPEFRAHLNMNTYLKSSDFQFWNKLRYIMPRKRFSKKRNNDQSLLLNSEETML